jgi:GAF domain-containing protein
VTKLKGRNALPVARHRGPTAADLQKQLDQRTRELADAQEHLAEALEQQAATSDVLQVVSSSPRELQPVFEAMLANATRICEATFGVMYLFEGDAFRAVALHGPAAFVEARRRNPILPLIPGTALGRVAATKRTVQIADVQAEPAYRESPAHLIGLETGGLRTVLSVPMLKQGELIGTFNVFRQEVRALLASGMGNTVTASGPRPRLRNNANSAHCSKCSALACREHVKPRGA